ncbi:MAG: 2-dehydropantoate 2-reductase [Deltaproteobacteria bacterium]|nr:2-dehydropantoate 2-reductase [Deltaproteobacteria bacterium]
MRIAVMGAGAVGGYFGARLAVSGQEVAFLARGRHLEAMRRGGLQVRSAQGDLYVQSLFTSDPEEVGPVDIILFCVKSYDTEEAGKMLAPLVGEKTVILSLQNGVDNPDKIARLWGESRTLAGVVYLGARLLTPGTIEHSAAGRITLGELGGGVSEGTKTISQILSAAQIPCAVSPEIRKVMWGKLVWNAPFCAIACLTRATVKEIVESDSLRELAIGCMHEVREAAKCQGIDLDPSVIAETLSLSHNLGDFKPSMLQDLEAGKPLEHEAFNGLVVDLLRQARKEAPINQVFYSALKFLDRKIRRVQAG